MLEKSFFYKTVLLPSLQLILTFFLMNEPFSSHADPLRPKKADAPPLTPATALLDTIGGALKTIREESPVFYHQLELKMIEKKQTLAEKFLSELSPAVMEQPQPAPAADSKENALFSSHLSNDRILYLGIGNFGQELCRHLEFELKKTIRDNMHLTGIILDLRSCSGGNAQDAQDVFSLLSFDAKHKAVLNDPVPILVLTDSETAGPAEILAKRLEHTRYGLCIGEKTKGTPFPRKKIHSGKLVLYVPLIPEELGTLTPDALTPAIRTAVKPRMKYRDLSENKPVTEKSDPALNRARGLLLSLDTLNKKWRK